jgi:DNA-binding protein HU-beta
MSNSRGQGEIHVTSKSGPLRIELYDHQFNRQGLGFGALRLTVPQGLYTLRYSAGTKQQDEHVRIEPSQTVSKEVTLSFPTTAPIGISSTSHEFHEEPAGRLSRSLPKHYGSGGGLMIFVRTVDRDGKAPVPIERLSLWDAELRQVGNLSADAERDPRHGWACLAAQVHPGGYLLRWRTMDRTSRHGKDAEPQVIDQALWVAPHWLTLVFIAHNAERGELERQSASIHMARLGLGFHPGPAEWKIKAHRVDEKELREAEVNQALDLALAGLRTGTVIVPDDLLALLLDAKFQNPMLGIIGAHALLQRRIKDWPLFDLVVRHLDELVHDHPDVLALRLLGKLMREREHVTPTSMQPLSWPPMIYMGYRGLIARDWQERNIVQAESMAERAAARLLLEGPLTCWRALAPHPVPLRSIPEVVLPLVKSVVEQAANPQAKLGKALRKLIAGFESVSETTAAEPSGDLLDPAVQRVCWYLDRLKQMGKSIDLEKLSLDEFSQTGLPVATVQRAIQTLINASAMASRGVNQRARGTGYMTKAEFIDQVVKSTKGMDLIKNAASELVDNIFSIVGRAIKEEGHFSYPGFGTFRMKTLAARTGRNPRTGTEIRIKANKTVGFKPAPSLKKML